MTKSGKYGCNMYEFGMSSISKVDGVIPILCCSLMTNKNPIPKKKSPSGSGKSQPGSGKSQPGSGINV